MNIPNNVFKMSDLLNHNHSILHRRWVNQILTLHDGNFLQEGFAVFHDFILSRKTGSSLFVYPLEKFINLILVFDDILCYLDSYCCEFISTGCVP